MKKGLWILILSLLLAGCVSQKKVMDSWIGHNDYEVTRSWGPPKEIISDGHGGKIHLYVTSNYYQGVMSGGQWVGGYNYWRYTMFFINSGDKVTGWLVSDEQIPPTQFDVNLYVHRGY